MGSIFVSLLNVSITASYVAIAAILLRVALKNAPKWISCLLWAFVAFRLLCPVSFESMFSLIPETEPITVPSISAPNEQRPMGGNGNINNDTNIQAPPVSVPTIPANPNTQVNTDTNPNSADTKAVAVTVFSYVWLAGLAAMLLYAVISYAKLRMKVKEAVREKEVWVTDKAETPFVLGVIRPRIYIPEGMNEADREYVTAHEKAHIRRLDHVWKPLGYVLLTVHWFNPIMWVVYYYLCRDIELACDEKVIKEKGESCKVGYTTALINCSASRRRISACPLAFGETAAKERVKTVLSYKKPTFWIIVVALVACAVTAVLLLTDKPEEKPNEDESNVSSTDESKDESSKDESNSAGTDNSTPHNHEEWLQQHYGDFYGLDTMKGLEVYVYEEAKGEYAFLLRSGANANAMPDTDSTGFFERKGVGVEDIKSILATYDMDKGNISVIPFKSTQTSYVSELYTYDESGHPLVQQEVYVYTVRKLLGLATESFVVGGNAYIGTPAGIDTSLFEEKREENKNLKPFEDNEKLVVEVNDTAALEALFYSDEDFGGNIDVLRNGKAFWREKYNDKFFEENSLLLVEIWLGSISYEVYFDSVVFNDGCLEMYVSADLPEGGNMLDAMGSWLLVKEIKKTTLEQCNEYDVILEHDSEYSNIAENWTAFMGITQVEMKNMGTTELARHMCGEYVDVAYFTNAEDLMPVFTAFYYTGRQNFGQEKYDGEFFKTHGVIVVKKPSVYGFPSEHGEITHGTPLYNAIAYPHNGGVYVNVEQYREYENTVPDVWDVIVLEVPLSEITEETRFSAIVRKW